MTTAIEPDELLVEIEIPPEPERSASAFCQFARRHGDFALAGAAVRLTVDSRRHCSQASIVLLGGSPTPLRATEAEALLLGHALDEAVATAAGQLAGEASRPRDHVDGSSGYRRELLSRLVARAILEATAHIEAQTAA
jgi:carbon-monoxide dehydrogenase medium subunit/6-hydroxypseudooxynicotine dehydrogenase subunit alpha